MNADCEFRIADYQKDRVIQKIMAIKKAMPASPNGIRIIQIASFLKENLSSLITRFRMSFPATLRLRVTTKPFHAKSLRRKARTASLKGR